MKQFLYWFSPIVFSFISFSIAFYIDKINLYIHKDIAIGAINIGQNIAYSIGLIFIWLFLIRLSDQLIFRFFLRKKKNIEISRFLIQVYNIFLLIIFIIGTLNVLFNIPIGGLLTAVSALGVGLGFGLKDLIADFFAGIALSIEKPFKINEFIRLENGHRAVVYDMTWRTTYLKTFEHNMISIPNSKINAMQIINYHRPYSTYHIKNEIYVDHYFSPEKVLRSIHAALEFEHIDNAASDSTVYIEDINDMGVKYVIRYNTLGILNEYQTRTRVLAKIVDNLHKIGAKPSFRKIDLFNKKEEHILASQYKEPKTFLKHIDLFTLLKDEAIDKLEKNIKKIFFKKGTIIVKQGDSGDSMFIIEEGLLSVEAIHDANLESIRITTLESGDYFGEFALLTGQPRTANVIAQTDCILYEVSADIMREILDTNEGCMKYLSEILTKRQLGLQSSVKNNNQYEISEIKQVRDGLLTKIIKFMKH